MKKIVIISFLMILSPIFIFGQGSEHYFFKESNILKPFLSEIRSTTIKGELAWLNKLDDNYYVSDYASRPFIEVHLGVELPVYWLENREKDLKFSASGFIGNILLIDMFESVTAPVINTDYFFGIKTAMVKYVDNSYIRNFGIKFVPLFHESTHIGDEFSIHGYNDIPGFRRVNISYEAWEVAAVINDPDTIKSNLFSAKVGFHGLWNNTKGYYTTDSLETKGVMAQPSQKNYEYYLQLNLQRTSGLLCSERWMNVISVEANNRLRFSYDSTIKEKRSWNFNIYFGWKHLTKNSNRNMGFFLRYYNGIIPNGQFRNTGGYQYAAISITYD
ncbi:MAG: DUF1207 domain-containing protein [Bacteroidia bacterium]|nr:MAG: DUF1207 domain-containing protein [Bacteroidia bacterium]